MSTEGVIYPEKETGDDKEEQTHEETQDKEESGESSEEVKEEKSEESGKEQAAKSESNEVVVPEKYDLKLPDESLLGDKALEQISQYAKEKGLSNEQAQDLLVRENSAVSSFADAQQKAFVDQVEGWKEAVSKDPEIGGEAFKENVELAKRALEAFGTPEFAKELNSSGFGNHPELVRMFSRVGRKLADPKMLGGDQKSQSKQSYAERFYGDSKT